MAAVTPGQLAERLDSARVHQVETIVSTLRGDRLVGVSGTSEAGKSKLLRLAAARLQRDADIAIAWVDLDGVYSARHLARRWLRAVARAAAGPVAMSHLAALAPEFWPGRTRSADHRVREVLLDDYDVAMGTRQGDRSKGGEDDVARALAATERLVATARRTLVVVDHLEAPLLSRALDVQQLLWQLRAVYQKPEPLGVALVCRPGAVAVATAEDAAFYGDGTWLTIDTPGADIWAGVLEEDGAELLRLTRGHVWSTLMVAARSATAADYGRTFAELVVESQPLAARAVQHAASLHRLGPELLRGIAAGLGPYEAIPDALTRDVAAAAQRLALAGLLHSPRRGVWQVVDPRVAAVLAPGTGQSGELR